jgi:hypothetical protein
MTLSNPTADVSLQRQTTLKSNSTQLPEFADKVPGYLMRLQRQKWLMQQTRAWHPSDHWVRTPSAVLQACSWAQVHCLKDANAFLDHSISEHTRGEEATNRATVRCMVACKQQQRCGSAWRPWMPEVSEKMESGQQQHYMFQSTVSSVNRNSEVQRPLKRRKLTAAYRPLMAPKSVNNRKESSRCLLKQQMPTYHAAAQLLCSPKARHRPRIKQRASQHSYSNGLPSPALHHTAVGVHMTALHHKHHAAQPIPAAQLLLDTTGEKDSTTALRKHQAKFI